jgi:hypothetical protein
VRTVLVFRLALLACNLANAGLVWQILKRIRPSDALTGLIFYAWNPVVVMRGQDHNEPVMALGLLLGVYALLQGRRWWGLAATTLSGLAKFLSLPQLALYLVHLWRRGSWRDLLLGSALAGGLGALLFMPVWGGRAMLDLATLPTQAPGSGPSGRELLGGGLALTALAWSAWRSSGAVPDLLRGWALTGLALFAFFPSGSYVWYLITLITLVALVDSPALHALTHAVWLTGLTNNLLVSFVAPWMALPAGTYSLVRWGPLAVVGAVVLWRGRGRWRRPVPRPALTEEPAVAAPAAPPGH